MAISWSLAARRMSGSDSDSLNRCVLAYELGETTRNPNSPKSKGERGMNYYRTNPDVQVPGLQLRLSRQSRLSCCGYVVCGADVCRYVIMRQADAEKQHQPSLKSFFLATGCPPHVPRHLSYWRECKVPCCHRYPRAVTRIRIDNTLE